jgi:beta-lactamase superfamily II metal-dependent hydrolase
MSDSITDQDLVIHILNVGFGDNIIIQFPVDANEQRKYALVDCRNSDKTKEYLNKLEPDPTKRTRLAFVCATHPHYDHISGIKPLLGHENYYPEEFWDCGFRHNSQTYKSILEALVNSGIKMVRVSSGMERYFGRVRVTVLSPSVALRNRYNTYGVDMNNASVVLRLEHHEEDVLLARSEEYSDRTRSEVERKAGKSVVILAGDAEFDSWAQITQEYPQVERTSQHDPLVKKMVNYLSCKVIKVAHHGSMHSAPLDVYEKMQPKLAIISTKQEVSTKTSPAGPLTRGLFPHQSAVIALEECGAKILTTDGSYEQQPAASIVVVVPPGRKPRFIKLNDDDPDIVPEPPPRE